MTDRKKARDLGNQSAALARSIADVLNDTLDALAAAEADLSAALGEMRQLLAENARLREALTEIVSYIDKGDVSIETIDQIARAALAKEDTDE